MANFKIEGLKELDRALGELPKATARNVLRRVLRKAAEPVKDAMVAKAPRDSGYTSESIEIGNTLNPANRRAQRREGKAFAEVYVGTRRGSAAHLQEFGTIKHPAHPFLRPAWEQTKDGALKIVTAELGEEIDKAAKRLARKRARAGSDGL